MCYNNISAMYTCMQKYNTCMEQATQGNNNDQQSHACICMHIKSYDSQESRAWTVACANNSWNDHPKLE